MEVTKKPDSCTISWIVIGSVIIEWQIHVDLVYQVYSALESKLSQLALQSVTHLSIPEVVRWAELPILWRGQEVTHIGPFEDFTKQLLHPLPEGLEWTTLSTDNIDEIMELYDSTYDGVVYKNAIQWNFSHPNYKSEFVFGVRESSSKKLVWALWCIPYHISIKGQSLPVVELQQAIHYGAPYKQDELFNVVTREAMRRVNKFGISQSVLILSTQIIRPTITLTIWMYNFLRSSHPLPYNSPRTAGLRKMMLKDVPSAMALFNQEVSHFEIGHVFQTEKEFNHYFLCPSIPGYIITFPSFNNVNDKMGKCATVSVIVNTKTPTRQLITDLLVCAKQEKVDVLSTQQYGLARCNFENLLVHYYQSTHWHIFNYSYPEVDEESCCVFCSIFVIGINKSIFEPGFVTKTKVMNQQFKEMAKDRRKASTGYSDRSVHVPQSDAEPTISLTDVPEMADLIKIVIPKIQAEWEDVAFVLHYKV
ncbi:glycylpeptide N-tetradecanoyltransferase 2-like isoform X2 [Dysidea avara]|uniref:glycylpeptide N-tetradecanoyltransferase 2-like isoform X2 n=1 Tax=Dysidea avara TaxID=196820 RepID=UPI0033294DC8